MKTTLVKTKVKIVPIPDRKNFNIKDFLKKRPLSWSAIISFEYDPEQWYRNYYLGERTAPSAEMMFGSQFAGSCEKRKPMAPVTLLSKMEQPFKVVFGSIPLVGYADTYDGLGRKKIGEYKTGVKAWTQKRVDEHGQITMYALMNHIAYKIRPEDCHFFLEWIPTQQNGDYTISLVKPVKVHHFKTKRTMRDVLNFGARINKTIKEMEAYVRNHQ